MRLARMDDLQYMIREGLWFQPSSFNQPHKTCLDGKLQQIERQPLRPEDEASFANGEYQTCISTDQLPLYRVYGQSPSGAGAFGGGRFATTEFAESRIDVKIRLALKPDWKNTRLVEELILVPAGTVLQVGKVAAVTLPTGTVLEGGADQVLLPYQWPSEWIQGYREITIKPLLELPVYSKEKPVEQLKKRG